MTKNNLIKDTAEFPDIILPEDTQELDELEDVSDIIAPPKPHGMRNSRPKPKKTVLARKRRAATPEEKELVQIKHDMSVAQAKLTRNKNKLTKILDEKPELIEKIDTSGYAVTAAKQAVKDQIRIVPNEGPQTQFLAADEDQVFYGGAKGGGKSYALVLDPLRYIHHPRFTGLLIRRTVPELADLIAQQNIIYKAVDPKSRFLKQEKLWEFSSGARLFLGYGETEEDLERYRGQSYQWLGFDELPQYPNPRPFHLMVSCVRSPYPDLPTRVRASGNPGNVGSAWVKEMFIDPSPPNQAFKVDVSYTNPLTKEHVESSITRKFIPAKVWDNPYLVRDPTYVASLASLPENMRRQMLEGDWDVSEGMAFPEFNRGIHTCAPFEIPYEWVRIRGADWGYSSPFAVYWMAFDEDNTCYVYREWYGKGVLADDWANTVCDMERDEAGLINYGVIDRSTASSRGETGPTIYESIFKTTRDRGHSIWRMADQSPNSRKQRKLEMHHRFALRDIGRSRSATKEIKEPIKKPRIVIFNTCVNLIRTISTIPLDKNDPELVDTKAEDHAFDALTYALMSRPISVEQNRKNKFFMQTPNDFNQMDSVFGY